MPTGQSRRVGYLIPEFPGQTHIFLWRERQALEEHGFVVKTISTKRPARAIASHSWSSEAEADTDYLLPLTAADLGRSLWEVLRAGPMAWGRVLQAVLTAEGLTLTGRLRLLAMTMVAAKLVWLSRQRELAHIHVHSCADSAHIAMLGWLLGRLPYSLTLHGPTLEGYGPNQRNKWLFAKFATVISQKLYGVVNTVLADARPTKMSIAPMGVDLAAIRRLQAYSPWQSGMALRVFSCGRLNMVKGHNYLIEAIAALRGQGIDARLEIAGQDELGGRGYRDTLVRQIENLGLVDSVHLLGAVSEERVRLGLEQAHLFVIASLDEGISVAIMEAMAMELPVIATDVGGNSELIDNGVNAIMVPPRDSVRLAQAMASVANNPAFAMKLAHASRDKIEQSFHHRVSADALAQHLSQAMSPPDHRH